MLSIWSSFADLPDPRTGNAQRHNLLDVLTIALTATICGAGSCVDFADFARDREALFRDFLDLPGGLPSHDTFSRLFRLLDPAAFAAFFAQFLDGLGETGLSETGPGVIAIDGKTMRRSYDRAAGRSALHVVTAFAADARMVIGQVGQAGERAWTAEFTVGEGGTQVIQEQVAELAGQHSHGQEEARFAGDPARLVGRDPAAGDDAVQMRVMVQRLSPAVQHRDRADLGAEVARVGGDTAQRLRRRAKQNGVDHGLVVERDLGDGGRQGERDVEVGDGQQFGLGRIEPVGARQALALRAMPIAAAVVRATNLSAIRAVLDMPTQHRRAARLDRRHHPTLISAEMVRVGVPIRRAVAAEDVRHLQRGMHRVGSGRRRDGDGQRGRLQEPISSPTMPCLIRKASALT